MTKTISFIGLCEMVEAGKQPEKISVSGSGEYKWVIDGYYNNSDGKDLLDNHTLNNLVKECNIRYDDSILTKEEKKYLSAIVEPFRGQSVSIHKSRSANEENNEYLVVRVNDESIYFPCFEKGKYYRGMDASYDYSLEELGIC